MHVDEHTTTLFPPQTRIVALSMSGGALPERGLHSILLSCTPACEEIRSTPMPLTVPQLKRKLRQLKQLELTIRFGRPSAPAQSTLLWDVYFSTKAADPSSVKYPLSHLLPLEHQELKAVFDEFCFRLYSQIYQDQGRTHLDAYDPQVLALLGLPPYAGIDEIT